MAGFFDDEGGSKDEFASVEDLAKETVEDNSAPKPEPKQDNIPNEYRGKTIEQIIEMHQNATKLIGRHSEEVGFAREMARKAAERIEALDKGSQKRTDADPQESDADFFAKPKQTVEKTISEHPDVIAAREFARQSAAERAYAKLKERIGEEPKAIVSDPDFAAWLEENPFRKNVLIHANANADADAAYEILRSFKRDKADKQAEADKSKTELQQKTDKDKKAVMVDTGVQAMPDKGRVYRASELRKLERTNPSLYEKLEPQIMRAYAEGRVRSD